MHEGSFLCYLINVEFFTASGCFGQTTRERHKWFLLPPGSEVCLQKCLSYVLQIEKGARERTSQTYFSNCKTLFWSQSLTGCSLCRCLCPLILAREYFPETKLRTNFWLFPHHSLAIPTRTKHCLFLLVLFSSCPSFLGAPSQKTKRSHLHQET